MKMKQTVIAATILACILGMAAGQAAAQGSGSKAQTETRVLKKQTLCPVSGNAIDTRTYVDHQGKRVYFSNKDNAAKFMANPEKYLKQMAEDGIALEATPASNGSGAKSKASEARAPEHPTSRHEGSGSK